MIMADKNIRHIHVDPYSNDYHIEDLCGSRMIVSEHDISCVSTVLLFTLTFVINREHK